MAEEHQGDCAPIEIEQEKRTIERHRAEKARLRIDKKN